MAKMTEKQRRFADEYIRTGNISESYRLAYPNVKKEGSASSAGSRMLKNVNVKSYIDKRLEELASERIADQQEIMEYLTSVMRGQVTDEQLLVVGDGDFGSSVEKHKKKSDTNDRTKAAELLGKRYMMFTDKVKHEGNVELVFEDDYGEED